MKSSSDVALSISALRLLPRNSISRLAGRLASLRFPQPLQRWLINAFAWIFGVKLEEVRDPLDSFSCVQDFFVRALVPDARPIDLTPDAIVSPCDGAWGEAGRIDKGQILQVKGRPYSLAALLGNDGDAKRYEGGTYATLYLSPRDYHRFHAPSASRVSRVRYLPGSLWPVNRAGVEGVESLFAQNERICAFMDLEEGQGKEQTGEEVCVVAVGATMVGKVKLEFDALTTNVSGAIAEARDYGKQGAQLDRGDEWGRFEFGSTLVVLLAPEAGALDAVAPGTPVKLGTRIGCLASRDVARATC
jgi:phosphatidylserine decarboxylase